MKVILREWFRDPKSVRLMLYSLVLSIIYTALNAWVITLISNTLTGGENFRQNLAILVLVCIIQCVLGPARGFCNNTAIRRSFGTINNAMAKKIVEADPEMFTRFSTAYVSQQVDYIGKITDAERAIVSFIHNMVKIITMLVSIWVVGGGKLVIAVTIIYAIGAAIFRVLFLRFEKLSTAINKLYKVRGQAIENTILGFMEVRTFNRGKKHYAEIEQMNSDIYTFGCKRRNLTVVIDLAFEAVDTVGLVAVIIYAVSQISAGLMDAAVGMSLVMYVFRIIEPLSNVLDFLDVIAEKKAGSGYFDKIMSYQNQNKPAGSINMSSFNTAIELKHVGFSYEDSANVLHDVSMVIPKGKKVGICGASGAGKSTLFKLLNRFYDESSGEILVDGINLHDISMGSYRTKVGSVHQENAIFPGTIKENVLYGNEDATETEMIEACRKAHIYDFIVGLPERFNTVVGPRGLTLSGGQKQRIALARLFLSNPEIILLDEATSALDNESETFIQDAIDALPGKTIITIAHRLSTIQNSDIIYVMGDGGILEHGTHEELIEKHGAYYAMQKIKGG